MTSYFRSLFGVPSNQRSSSSSAQDPGLTRSRTRSSQSTTYSSSPTSSRSSSAARPSAQRSNSYTAARPTTPSPLRGGSYDSSNTHDHSPRRSSSRSHSHSKTKSVPTYYQGTPTQHSSSDHGKSRSCPQKVPTLINHGV